MISQTCSSSLIQGSRVAYSALTQSKKVSRDPPSFFLSFPSRELRLSPPQMSVSLRLDSILRSVPLLRRPTMPLPCYQLRVYLSSFFLFPFFSPFLVHLSPYSLFGSSSSLSLPLAQFPLSPIFHLFHPSYLAVFFQLKTTVHTLSVAFCLAQYVASTNIYLFSFSFILDLSSSSSRIFHQNSFDCPKKNFSSSIFLSIVQF